MRAVEAALEEERRGRATEWKAGVDASIDLPDPSDIDAMLPEIAGKAVLFHLVGIQFC